VWSRYGARIHEAACAAVSCTQIHADASLVGSSPQSLIVCVLIPLQLILVGRTATPRHHLMPAGTPLAANL
jgi:hypothetical protein